MTLFTRASHPLLSPALQSSLIFFSEVKSSDAQEQFLASDEVTTYAGEIALTLIGTRVPIIEKSKQSNRGKNKPRFSLIPDGGGGLFVHRYRDVFLQSFLTPPPPGSHHLIMCLICLNLVIFRVDYPVDWGRGQSAVIYTKPSQDQLLLSDWTP